MGRTAVVALRGGMSGLDARRLAARVERLLLEERAVVCEVVGDDLGVVDALARVRVVVTRLGAGDRVRVTGCERLADLVRLTGLGEALRQVRREPEPREQ